MSPGVMYRLVYFVSAVLYVFYDRLLNEVHGRKSDIYRLIYGTVMPFSGRHGISPAETSWSTWTWKLPLLLHNWQRIAAYIYLIWGPQFSHKKNRKQEGISREATPLW